MTADEFKEWLEAMQVSGAEAARLLGVQPNTITRYRRKGGPKMLALACERLLTHRQKDLRKEALAERKRSYHREYQRLRAAEERQRKKYREDEMRPFTLGVHETELGLDPCLILGKASTESGTIHLIRIVYPDGELSDEHWCTLYKVRPMSPEEEEGARRYFATSEWMKRAPEGAR